jgi:predicted DNA-binding transcriptional regulator AlpA
MEDNAILYHLLKVFSELENRLTHQVVSMLSESLRLGKETSLDNEKLMTDDDICDYLQISSSTFYKFKKRHKGFPQIRIQSTVRYRKSEVDDFLLTLK